MVSYPSAIASFGAAATTCGRPTTGVTATNIQFRQATFIETSMDNLKRVLVEAAVVVAVVLIAFLMNVRATFISLTAIPISVLTTLVVFQAFGLTINTMTLGGLAIAIGALVDDAVVDVENILRRLKENRARPDPRPVPHRVFLIPDFSLAADHWTVHI